MNKEARNLVETVKQKKESSGFFNPQENGYNTEGGYNYNTNNRFSSTTERTELCQSFKDILHLEKKPVGEVYLLF